MIELYVRKKPAPSFLTLCSLRHDPHCSAAQCRLASPTTSQLPFYNGLVYVGGRDGFRCSLYVPTTVLQRMTDASPRIQKSTSKYVHED